MLANTIGPVPMWLLILGIGGWLVLMCLKTIGHGYDTAVRIHNLRVEAQRLKLHHEQDLNALKRETVLAAKRRLGRQFGKLDHPDSNSAPTPATEPLKSPEPLANAA